MKRKILIPMMTLAVILTTAFVVQPEIAQVSANLGDLLIFNRLCPVGNIYRFDTVIFGGTIHNNDSRDYLLTEMRANFYAEENRTEIVHFYEYLFQHEVTRDELPPGLSRTITFQAYIDVELDIENNYTVMLMVSYYEEGTEVSPFTRQIGNNATVNVLLRRIDAPNYIWAVMVLLSIGILAFVIVGFVGWIRERRARQ